MFEFWNLLKVEWILALASQTLGYVLHILLVPVKTIVAEFLMQFVLLLELRRSLKDCIFSLSTAYSPYQPPEQCTIQLCETNHTTLALCFTIDSLFQSLLGWYAVEYPVFRPSDYESPFDHVMTSVGAFFLFVQWVNAQ